MPDAETFAVSIETDGTAQDTLVKVNGSEALNVRSLKYEISVESGYGLLTLEIEGDPFELEGMARVQIIDTSKEPT